MHNRDIFNKFFDNDLPPENQFSLLTDYDSAWPSIELNEEDDSMNQPYTPPVYQDDIDNQIEQSEEIYLNFSVPKNPSTNPVGIRKQAKNVSSTTTVRAGLISSPNCETVTGFERTKDNQLNCISQLDSSRSKSHGAPAPGVMNQHPLNTTLDSTQSLISSYATLFHLIGQQVPSTTSVTPNIVGIPKTVNQKRDSVPTKRRPRKSSNKPNTLYYLGEQTTDLNALPSRKNNKPKPGDEFQNKFCRQKKLNG